MSRPARYLEWMSAGYRYFATKLASLDDADLAEPSALPGWSRKHVVAHVGFNARALGRLTCWAITGEATPMYPTTTARADEIADGALWSASRLRALVDTQQRDLSAALTGMDDESWSATVTTAQGRSVPATEIPWLRTREVWVHAIDLDAGGDLDDFPADMLDHLLRDAVAKHRASDAPTLSVIPTDREVTACHETSPATAVEGRTSDLARWVTGRGTRAIRTVDRTPLPDLGPWL
jgi:maleylpyruvate isomerase